VVPLQDLVEHDPVKKAAEAEAEQNSRAGRESPQPQACAFDVGHRGHSLCD
jgi:hypothetical protein